MYTSYSVPYFSISFVYSCLYCFACVGLYFLTACAQISPMNGQCVFCSHPFTNISIIIIFCSALVYVSGIGVSSFSCCIVLNVLLKFFPTPSQYGIVFASPVGVFVVLSSL